MLSMQSYLYVKSRVPKNRKNPLMVIKLYTLGVHIRLKVSKITILRWINTLYFPINKVKNLIIFDTREDEEYEYKLIFQWRNCKYKSI